MVDSYGEGGSSGPLGAALRRAWVGYQMALDTEMATAGFTERRFPDGRVLHLCRNSDGVTISDIGRDIGISRQAASKVVTAMVERGYVTVSASASDGREKIVTLTDRARDYLKAQRISARRIEGRVRSELGIDAYETLVRLADLLSLGEDVRLRDYIRSHRSGIEPFI
jgi:DNA-binding MarR family transcriptional regulator